MLADGAARANIVMHTAEQNSRSQNSRISAVFLGCLQLAPPGRRLPLVSDEPSLRRSAGRRFRGVTSKYNERDPGWPDIGWLL